MKTAMCPECNLKMKSDTKVMSFKLSPTITVQNVKYEHCSKCGYECISDKEFDRLNKLVHKLKKDTAKENIKNIILF
jgi:uncharacterized protein with PIN domain